VESDIEELGCSLGEELLRPTRIYVKPVLETLERVQVNGMIHNTGGGFYDNIPRVLPRSCRAVIDTSTWSVPPVFTFLAERGGIGEQEMFRTFNMGIGYMLVVPEDQAENALQEFAAGDIAAAIIGTIERGAEEDPDVVIG
jgi:phosphoribosylformylglycinamidine cyclo-ligase